MFGLMTVIMIIDVLGHETYSVTAAMLALLAVLQCAKWSYTKKKKKDFHICPKTIFNVNLKYVVCCRLAYFGYKFRYCMYVNV